MYNGGTAHEAAREWKRIKPGYYLSLHRVKVSHAPLQQQRPTALNGSMEHLHMNAVTLG